MSGLRFSDISQGLLLLLVFHSPVAELRCQPGRGLGRQACCLSQQRWTESNRSPRYAGWSHDACDSVSGGSAHTEAVAGAI